MASCTNSQEDQPSNTKNDGPLPIYGHKEFIEGMDEDTVYHVIPDWEFVNQDSVMISKDDFIGQPYIAYFFFTTCPGICPAITGNMVHVEQELREENIQFIAHTVDPAKDTVAALKEYAELFDIPTEKFHFITGDQTTIYELGVKGYLVPNQEDALAPGGFLHSEKLILLDSKSRIRGYYDGTVNEQVEQLIIDAKKLIKDESKRN